MRTEFTPEAGSIILGADDDGDWTLQFTDASAGETITIHLPDDQLREMDAEFTGRPGQ